MTRWMTTGVLRWPSRSSYVQPKRRGNWKSSWMVPICHCRPSASYMTMSIFGP